MDETYAGGCLCGSLRYVARGKPINERVCHCRLCQKAIGAAFNARLLFPMAQVTVEGETATFNSSPDLKRHFCPHCGTTVFSERASTRAYAVTCASLDEPERFRPDMHFWTSSRQPWVRLDDGLPQFPEAAPP